MVAVQWSLPSAAVFISRAKNNQGKILSLVKRAPDTAQNILRLLRNSSGEEVDRVSTVESPRPLVHRPELSRKTKGKSHKGRQHGVLMTHNFPRRSEKAKKVLEGPWKPRCLLVLTRFWNRLPVASQPRCCLKASLIVKHPGRCKLWKTNHTSPWISGQEHLQERKISPKKEFLGRISRGHPGVIRADIPAQNFGQGALNPGKKQAFGHGYPQPEGADVHDPKGFPKTSVRKTLG